MENNPILVEQAQSGDVSAFEALVRTHEKMVYRLALHMTGNAEDAADLTQEAFLSAWRGLPSFQQESTFSTWLYRLTTNACIDFLRKEKRRKQTPLVHRGADGEEHTLELPDPGADPQEAAEQSERAAAIQRGMAQLSPGHRQVLLLRELSGLSYREIADVLEVEEGTVKSRIARARLSLREVLLSDGNFSGQLPSKNDKK